jgi:hypothetical protein
MSSFSLALPSIDTVRSAVVSNRTAMTALAVVFIFSFFGMITSAVCADHIGRSPALAKDEDLQTARQWALWSAIISGLVAGGSVIGVGYLVYSHWKK